MEIMNGLRLIYKKKINCYWKYENVAEVQKQYRREFQADPPTDQHDLECIGLKISLK